MVRMQSVFSARMGGGFGYETTLVVAPSAVASAWASGVKSCVQATVVRSRIHQLTDDEDAVLGAFRAGSTSDRHHVTRAQVRYPDGDNPRRRVPRSSIRQHEEHDDDNHRDDDGRDHHDRAPAHALSFSWPGKTTSTDRAATNVGRAHDVVRTGASSPRTVRGAKSQGDEKASEPRCGGVHQIRPVEPHEYHLLGELLVEAYDSIPGAQQDPHYDVELADVATRVTSSTVLVAVDGSGTVLGGVTYTDDGGPLCELSTRGEGEIRMFAVAQWTHGRGTGSALVKACIALAEAQQRSRIWLSTSPWMTDAQRLFEHLGFLRRPERDRVDRSSGQDWELWAYVLSLESVAQPPRVS